MKLKLFTALLCLVSATKIYAEDYKNWFFEFYTGETFATMTVHDIDGAILDWGHSTSISGIDPMRNVGTSNYRIKFRRQAGEVKGSTEIRSTGEGAHSGTSRRSDGEPTKIELQLHEEHRFTQTIFRDKKVSVTIEGRYDQKKDIMNAEGKIYGPEGKIVAIIKSRTLRVKAPARKVEQVAEPDL